MKLSKSAALGKSAGPIGLLVLFVLLVCLLGRCFLPNYVLFSNDGPLGLQKAAWLRLPQAFLGQWYDLNTFGVNGGASLPDISTLIRWILGPVGYAKFLTPISLWILGASAFFCFRRSGMAVITSILGGLAACLTTGFFTNACWGAAPPIIAFGMDFLALGALVKRDKFPFWVAPALGGMAVGINVMEAADIGALFSLLVAAFVVYQSVAEGGSSALSRTARGVGRIIIVAGFAGFIAAYAVSALIGSNITGIAGTKQDEQTKAARWDFATQWSMPKRETLALIVPNLYGCSVITPGAANYWGGLGTDPEWDRYFASNEQGPPPQPGHFLRHTGRGIYLGSFVVLIAFWAALQSFRRKDSVFTLMERKLVWFWLAVALLSLLLAYGRFAPFYRLVYKLPYFSTIRNPDKFLHIVTFASVILFAYGIHGLYRRFLDLPLVNAPNGRLKAWWAKTATFDRRWVVGSFVAILLSGVAWGAYAGMRGHVEDYLVELQRVDALRNGKVLDSAALSAAHAFAASQVSFSLEQVGWFVLFLTLGSIVLMLILAGTFAGRRLVWAGVFLGIILVGDLGRANLPYINFWNYKEKYEAGNPEPVIKFLATKPYEHRVAYLLPQPFMTPGDFGPFQELYNIEWTQQLFPYYNIQTLDIVQMPRMPEDLDAFNVALRPGFLPDGKGGARLDDKTFYRIGRNWQLSATRYLVGPAPLLDAVNQQFYTAPNRFQIIQRFEIGPRPGVDRPTQYSQVEAVPVESPNGNYALYEFMDALPRATLFSNWEVDTNAESTLGKLVSAAFDPSKTVLLPKPLPTGAKPAPTNQVSEAVQFTSYEPADIKLDATPTRPSILMMCDKYDPDWQVWVDGKRGELLKCDYLMRGVFLEPGHHEVEFKFRPNIKMLYVNLAAIFIGACMLGYVMVASRKESPEDARVADKANPK